MPQLALFPNHESAPASQNFPWFGLAARAGGPCPVLHGDDAAEFPRQQSGPGSRAVKATYTLHSEIDYSCDSALPIWEILEEV